MVLFYMPYTLLMNLVIFEYFPNIYMCQIKNHLLTKHQKLVSEILFALCFHLNYFDLQQEIFFLPLLSFIL